jgi:hypothetical protein
MSPEPLLNFDEWVKYHFDNAEGCRWFDRLGDRDAYPHDLLLTYVTKLFENSSELLTPYSNAQINQTLWFLLGTETEVCEALFDPHLPWPTRRRCLGAIYALFQDCSLPRCEPCLAHLNENASNELNSICYMFWDIFPWGSPDDVNRRQADLLLRDLMTRILALDSLPCQESALHGLGATGEAATL